MARANGWSGSTAANRIREEVDPDANILFGSTFEPEMEGKVRVSVVATGIDASEMKSRPEPLRSPSNSGRAAPAPLTISTADRPASEETPKPAVEESASEAAPLDDETAVTEIEDTADIEVDVVSDSDEKPEEEIAAPVAEEIRPQPQVARVEPSVAFRQPEATPRTVAAPAAPVAAAPTAPAPSPAPAPAPTPAPSRSEAMRRTPFIPPKPMTPAAAAGKEEREPSIISSARSGEHVGELAQPARRRSLFERMTGVSRPKDTDGDNPARSGRQPVEPRLNSAGPARTEAPAQKAAPENPPARTQPESGNISPEPAPSPEEEVLEIPAFLRRQAN